MYLFLVNFVVNKDNDLKEANVFVIMLLFNLMTFPLGILPWSMGIYIQINYIKNDNLHLFIINNYYIKLIL